jgi:hypothetical protein
MKTTRKSPTEGAPPSAGVVVLLPFEPGKAPDASAWKCGPRKPQDDEADHADKRHPCQDFVQVIWLLVIRALL